jgi:hypothetical protein
MGIVLVEYSRQVTYCSSAGEPLLKLGNGSWFSSLWQCWQGCWVWGSVTQALCRQLSGPFCTPQPGGQATLTCFSPPTASTSCRRFVCTASLQERDVKLIVRMYKAWRLIMRMCKHTITIEPHYVNKTGYSRLVCVLLHSESIMGHWDGLLEKLSNVWGVFLTDGQSSRVLLFMSSYSCAVE